MENIEILYDHYKETNNLSLNAQKQRGRYFNFLCIAEILNIIFMFSPREASETLATVLNKNYNILIQNPYFLFQSMVWILIAYFTLIYFQKNIYVERQYKYLTKLEIEIAKLLNTDKIMRESKNYKKSYPKILKFINFFYKWIIPLFLIVITSIKISLEIANSKICGFTLIDIAVAIYILILCVLYILYINFRK